MFICKMASRGCLIILLLVCGNYFFYSALSAPEGSYGGYVKCPDGSSPQKDANGQTVSCTQGQTYAACQQSYQCTTPLPGRPGVCCNSGSYVGATPAPPPPVTYQPPPPATGQPPPPPVTYQPPISNIFSPPPPQPPQQATDPPTATDQPAPPTDSGQFGGAAAEISAPPAPPAPLMTDPPVSNIGAGALISTTTTSSAGATTPLVTGTTLSVVTGATLPPEVQIINGNTDTTLSHVVPSSLTNPATQSTGAAIVVNTDGHGNFIVSPQSVLDNSTSSSMQRMFEMSPPPPQMHRRGRRPFASDKSSGLSKS